MAYSDALTVKLLALNPTRLLLCNSIGYFDGISLPQLSPNTLPIAGFFLALYCFYHQLLFLLFKQTKSLYLNEYLFLTGSFIHRRIIF